MASCGKHEENGAGSKTVSSGSAMAPKVNPALTVRTVTPHKEQWVQAVEASGSVQAWQEAIIGAEIGGLQLEEVLVNVGDTVRQGQLLARLRRETVEADNAQQRALVAEAEANLMQAKGDADRAALLDQSGAISRQQINQYQTTAKTAEAKLASARAALAAQALRLRFTEVRAPDEGVISTRTATVGAVVASGGELFRLIRKNRLEWRAELRGDNLLRLQPGQVAEINETTTNKVTGTVRQIGPTVDAAARNGLAYVDLPANSNLKPGMFVSGRIVVGEMPAWTIPQEALVLRDGYSYAMAVMPDGRVRAMKMNLGRRQGGLVEVLDGIKTDQAIVASGGSFLNDGDVVRIAQDNGAGAKAVVPAAGAEKE
jgi:RND family efflux transporter MFP subunit